jgi:hypothetical protein
MTRKTFQIRLSSVLFKWCPLPLASYLLGRFVSSDGNRDLVVVRGAGNPIITAAWYLTLTVSRKFSF